MPRRHRENVPLEVYIDLSDDGKSWVLVDPEGTRNGDPLDGRVGEDASNCWCSGTYQEAEHGALYRSVPLPNSTQLRRLLKGQVT